MSRCRRPCVVSPTSESHQPTISLSSVTLSNPSAPLHLSEWSQAESPRQLASASAAHIIDTNGDGSLVQGGMCVAVVCVSAYGVSNKNQDYTSGACVAALRHGDQFMPLQQSPPHRHLPPLCQFVTAHPSVAVPSFNTEQKSVTREQTSGRKGKKEKIRAQTKTAALWDGGTVREVNWSLSEGKEMRYT